MNLGDFHISALLHDIGKFIERSRKYRDIPQEYSSSVMDVRYAHPRYGAFWVDTVAKADVPLFRDIPPERLKEISDMIAYHHDPRKFYEKLLQLADWISSSERAPEEKPLNDPYYRQPVCSIFPRILQDNGASHYSYRSLPLGFETIFPDGEKVEANYDGLEKDFEAELRHVDTEDKLLYLLEKYTWCIPAQTGEYTPDVSLYDHLRTTAAIAVCLWHEAESGNIDKDTLNRALKNFGSFQEELFLLVGGDLSGIQDFIFNIPSKGAAKSLKGRSLYLSMLPEVVALYMVDRLSLKKTNILYVGGGGFQLIVPRCKLQELESLRREISERILEAHGDSIYLALDWVGATVSDFSRERYKELRMRLSETLQQRKRRRYTEIMDKGHFPLIFGIPGELNSGGRHCVVCGESRQEHLSSDGLCKMCESFEELTDDVKLANFCLIRRVECDTSGEIFTYRDVFASMGYDVRFSKDTLNGYSSYALNDFSLEGADGFRIGAFSLPKDTFEDIAKKSKGDKLLAYVKMDVDNLGSIFQEGLGEDYSVSRVATLSRMLSLFFEGYIQHALKDDRVYLLYAGGDDTFIIGAWDFLLKKLVELKESFDRFVAGNPKVTFSAGVGLFRHGFPVNRAAQIVEEELERSKHFKYPEEERESKNKITLFGETFSWDEYLVLVGLWGEMVSMVNDGMSRSVLQRIKVLTSDFKPLSVEKEDLGKPWRFYYTLRDVKKDYRRRLVDIYEKMWLGEMAGDNEESACNVRNFKLFSIAARLAELETKKE